MLSQSVSTEDQTGDESQRKSGRSPDKRKTIKTEENEDIIEDIEHFGNNDCEENCDNIIIDDKNENKSTYKVFVPTKKSPFSVYMKEDLLSVCRNAFAFHRLSCGAKLMHALCLDMRTPHFMIMRAALILFTQHSSDHNTLLTQSIRKISKYDVDKKEIMLEMIIHFLSNNNRIAAKEYIEANQMFVKLNLYRNDPIINTYLKCYISYVDYLEWKELVNENVNSFYYRLNDSTQIISDKTKLALRNTITDTNSKDCRLDIFVLILLEMYEHSQQYDEAIDLLQFYVKQNSHHLNAFIYLYNFCLKYPDYSTGEQLIYALKNICRLSPENILVLELVKKNVLSDEDNFELIMEFISYTANNHNMDAWLLLNNTLNNIKNDKKTTKIIVNKWRKRYKFYWLRIHFNCFGEQSTDLIECKREVISFLESPSHKYVLETNKLLSENK